MWEVYSVGNATFLIEVYRGIARFWSTNDVYVMISAALVIGLLWNTLNWAMNQEKAPFPAKGFVFSIILVLAFLGPQSLTDVRVVSKKDSSFQVIDNVPLLPAVGGWLITTTGTALADVMAQAFSIADIDSWQALSPIQHFVNLSDTNYSDACIPKPSQPGYNICKTFNSYLNDCFVASNMITPGASNSIDKILSAKPQDLFPLLVVTNEGLEARSYLVDNNPAGVVKVCKDLHSDLSNAMSDPAFKDNLKKSMLAQGVDLDEVGTFLRQYGAQGVIPAAESSLQLANAAFMRSIFRDYFNSSPYGQQVARAMFDTVRQRQLANASKKEYWMENAEVMQSFLEALTVFLTPFLALVLSISGQGLLAVGQYFAAWAFVQLWSVMIVLVNMFTALAMTNRFTDAVSVGKSQFSLSSIDSQFATANSYIGISGLLYTMIPPICIFVLYRGVHAIQGMSRQAMADPNINSQRLSPDTGASVSNGQAAYGNHTSQFNNATQSWSRGDVLPQTSWGSTSIGNSLSAGVTSGNTMLAQRASSMSQMAQRSIDNVFGTQTAGGEKFTDGSQTSYTASSAKEWLNSMAHAISDNTSLSFKEAQQLVASGAVQVDAAGQLSFSAALGHGGKSGTQASERGGPHVESRENTTSALARLGASIGASINAAFSAQDQMSNTADKTIAKAGSLSQQETDKINQNLSRIKTAGDVSEFSDVQSINQSAKDAEAYTRQAQQLEQQGLMLNNLVSNASSVANNASLDNAGMSSKLENTSFKEFLGEDLWNNIKSMEIDGKSGDQWLQDKSQTYFGQRDGYSANALGDSRAMALMDLIKQNDNLDLINKEDGQLNQGVDLNRELKDAQVNRDIFQAMDANGIANSHIGAEVYAAKMETMQQMAEIEKSMEQGKERFNQVPLPNSSPEGFVNAADERQNTAQQGVGAAQRDTAGAQQNVQDEANANGIVLSDDPTRQGQDMTPSAGTGVDPNAAATLAETRNELDDSQIRNKGHLDAVEGNVGNVTELTKGSSDTQFSNFIEKQVAADGNLEGYRTDYLDGAKALDGVTTFTKETLTDRLQKHASDEEKTNTAALISMLSNDQVMTDILGKNEDGTYGTGTQMARETFNQEVLQVMSEGANYMRDYNAQDSTLSRDNSIDTVLDNDRKPEVGEAALVYAEAKENTGFIHNSSSEYENRSSTAELVNTLLTGTDEEKAQETKNFYTGLTSDNLAPMAFGFGASSTEINDNKQDKRDGLKELKEMIGEMKDLLTDDQQGELNTFVENAERAINPDYSTGMTNVGGH